MPEITPDLSDTSRCVSVHWSLPVQCVLPRTHADIWHEAWHPQSGNRIRYRRAMGVFVTEDHHDSAWHDLAIPAPGAVCGEPHSSKPGVFCQLEHGKDGLNENRWNHVAVVDGCRHSWNTPHAKALTVEQLTVDVGTLRAGIEELHAALTQSENDLTGARLSLWEEEQDHRRTRTAFGSARKRAARLRARVAELESERHSTNEALATKTTELATKTTELAAHEALAELAVEYRVSLPDGTAWLSVRREPRGTRWAVISSVRVDGHRQAWTGDMWTLLGSGMWAYTTAEAAVCAARGLAEEIGGAS